jgi:hypothetical protein
MGLSFTIAAGLRQRSHSRVQIPWASRPYFTVSDSNSPNLKGQVPVFTFPEIGWSSYTSRHCTAFSLHPTTRKATVEVFHTGWLTVKVKVKVKVVLPSTVSRPVCLGIKHPSGTQYQIFITVKQRQACWCGALSLTRGRVCHLPVLQSAVISLLSICTIYI